MRFGSVCSGIEAASCKKCLRELPLERFNRKGSGLQPWCKDCHNQYQRETRKRRETPEKRREQNLRARYGITADEFESLLASQGGKCAVCNCEPSKPVVDHDHSTGKRRGILCHACNMKLAAIEDDLFARNAAAYLARHK